MIKNTTSLIFLLLSIAANAQVEMADTLRSNGKIYIVVAVILIIMAGFFTLLFKLDRRTKRLEEEIRDK